MKEKKKRCRCVIANFVVKDSRNPIGQRKQIFKIHINKWFTSINVPTPSYLVFPRAFFAPLPEPEGKKLNDYLI